MIDRKTIKNLGMEQAKRHYVLLVLMCAVSIFLGAEFSGIVSNAQTWYDVLTNQQFELEIDGILDNRSVAARLINRALNVNLETGRDESAARIQAIKDGSDPNAMLGRQKGALAALMNSLDSGRLYVTLGLALNSIIESRRAVVAVMILGGATLYGAVWIFLRNLYRATLRRAYLETRTYRRMPLNHLLHIKLVRRWTRASLTLLLQSIYETLWYLTLVGGLVKRYSYFLVPFIVAENPDVRPRAAITLSRRMMKGHKWECFVLDLSFVGWMFLGFVTFGLTDVLWGVPYRMAVYTEYYARLRELAKANNLEGAELLNDDWLYAVPDEGERFKRYADIVLREELLDEDIVLLTPIRRFFAHNFGIWWGTLAEKIVYTRQEGLRQQTRVDRMELKGEAYPLRMNPLWTREKAAFTGKVSYLAPVTIWTLIVVFFVFCCVGWLWEVALHLMTHGTFVNRGALHGPWLPIYGGGVVMISVLLYRFRTKPALEALAVTLLCGAVEYMTSFFMELSSGMRWWDYTGYFLNLNGRICAEGLAMFAVGGMAAVYLLVPLIDNKVTHARHRVLVPVCIALMIAFAGDVVYSHKVPNAGEGITDDPVVAQVEEGTASL